MSVSVRPFGSTRAGEEVRAYTITNAAGACAVLLDYGATVQSLLVPGRDGKLTDVVLGYDSVAGYEDGGAFIGATIGRVGNRIGGACFSLGGKTYALAKNDGDNTLHGGKKGFDRHVWQAEIVDALSVRFSRLSPDGEENFPGNLRVSVLFTLDDDCALRISYDAVSDADTLVNLTNHSYFDLSGCGRAMEQTLWLNAERFLELGAGTLPDGVQLPVEGTPFDFRTPKPVGRDIDADDTQLRAGGGYDHNFCLGGGHAATLESAVTGIRMDTFTDLPGVQFYAGNCIAPQQGKGGVLYNVRTGFCLETQYFPNSANDPAFAHPIFDAGQKYKTTTIYRFR